MLSVRKNWGGTYSLSLMAGFKIITFYMLQIYRNLSDLSHIDATKTGHLMIFKGRFIVLQLPKIHLEDVIIEYVQKVIKRTKSLAEIKSAIQRQRPDRENRNTHKTKIIKQLT